MEVYFETGSQLTTSEITFHLRESAQTSTDILSARIEIKSVNQPGFYRVSFTPQSDSYMKDYFLLLELKGAGTLQLGASTGNSYQDGALYVNGAPLDQQLTFQQVYAPAQMAAGMGWQVFQWLWQLFIAVLVFVLPGWALLSGLWSGWKELEWGEKLALAAGVGLSISPVFFLWMNQLGIQLGIFFALVPMFAGGIFLVWKNRSALHRIHFRFHWPGWKQIDWPAISLVFTLVCVIGIRLWAIRGIEYPMWGDSYQHTMITQLILDHNGLFQSWSPYVPYTSLTVQYGFPGMVAIYSWISGMQPPQATLFVGQVINALAILALYPLMMRISGKRRWAGIAALIAGGLMIPMPIFYVNWGRYAQLGGQAILPVAVWLCWDSFTQPRIDLKKVAISGVVIAGMLLSYYRMFFYFATFFLAWMVTWGLPTWHLRIKPWKGLFIGAFFTILITLIILAPWLVNVSSSSLASGVEAGLTSANPLENVLSDYAAWKQITDYLPLAIMGFSVLALLLSLILKKWIVAGTALWTGLMASLVAGQIIHLPGANMMQNFAVLIFLYIPASLLTGWGIGEAANWLDNRVGNKAGFILLVAATAVSLWGVYGFRNISDTVTYQYVTRPDLRAADWIRVNTPPDSIFLVEGYRIYNGLTAVGGDGGWWLPLLADRRNTMPPQYALLNEMSQPKDYSKKVVDLIAVLENDLPDSPAGLASICQMGISYVYIGQKQGSVGAGVRQLFNRDLFLKSDRFIEVYHQDQVSIFSLNTQTCQNPTNIPYAQN